MPAMKWNVDVTDIFTTSQKYWQRHSCKQAAQSTCNIVTLQTGLNVRFVFCLKRMFVNQKKTESKWPTLEHLHTLIRWSFKKDVIVTLDWNYKNYIWFCIRFSMCKLLFTHKLYIRFSGLSLVCDLSGRVNPLKNYKMVTNPMMMRFMTFNIYNNNWIIYDGTYNKICFDLGSYRL